jgi:hypothetical protein
MRSDEVDEEEVVGEVNDEAGASGWAVNEESWLPTVVGGCSESLSRKPTTSPTLTGEPG